jgi:DUF4097 and DUF4098 domain-containing protein YvlB
MSARDSVHHGVRRVVVDNLGSGLIAVEPSDQPDQVVCSVHAVDEQFLAEVQVRQEQDTLRLSVPTRLIREPAVDLRLRVPAGLEYVIKVGSADIAFSADIGRSKITSGSGNIALARAADLDCSTGSGDVSVVRMDGTSGRVSSGSGGVSLGEVHCPITAKSGSGDVTVQSVQHANVQANSASGDIAVSSTSGSVDLRTASGGLSIGVADHLPAWLDLHSVSGEIRISLESSAEPTPGEPYVSVRARTASGDIAVYRAA